MISHTLHTSSFTARNSTSCRCADTSPRAGARRSVRTKSRASAGPQNLAATARASTTARGTASTGKRALPRARRARAARCSATHAKTTTAAGTRGATWRTRGGLRRMRRTTLRCVSGQTSRRRRRSAAGGRVLGHRASCAAATPSKIPGQKRARQTRRLALRDRARVASLGSSLSPR